MKISNLVIAMTVFVLAACSGNSSGTSNDTISNTVYSACMENETTCKTKAVICKTIRDYAKDHRFDRIGTYRNMSKNEDLTVSCMQYGNIYRESLWLFRQDKELSKIISSEECRSHGEYAGVLLSTTCYEQNYKKQIK